MDAHDEYFLMYSDSWEDYDILSIDSLHTPEWQEKLRDGTAFNQGGSNEQAEQFECGICNNNFTSSGALLTHSKAHNGERNSGDKQFKGKICRKSFSESGSLTVHRRIHSGDKPYKCKACSKCFSDNSNLTKHERTHSGDKKVQHQKPKQAIKMCQNCGKVFTTCPSWSRHKRNCGQTNLISCVQCGKAFKRRDSLKRHFILCTNKLSPNTVCNVCLKEFRSNWHLKQHLPCKGNLVCVKCNLSFRKIEKFRLHKEKCIHTNRVRKENVDDQSMNEDERLMQCHKTENTTLNGNYTSSKDVPVVEQEIEDRPSSNGSLSEEHVSAVDCDETNVYIIDEGPYMDTENGFVYPDIPHQSESGFVDCVNGELVQPKINDDVNTLRNRKLSKLIAGAIRNVFDCEEISDPLEQLQIVKNTLEEIGLRTHLIMDNSINTS